MRSVTRPEPRAAPPTMPGAFRSAVDGPRKLLTAPFTAPEGRKWRKETLARPRETMSETLESLRETMRGTLESLL